MQKLLRSSKLSCSKPFITLLKQQISNCCTVKKSHRAMLCIAYAQSAYDYARLMWIAVGNNGAAILKCPISSSLSGYRSYPAPPTPCTVLTRLRPPTHPHSLTWGGRVTCGAYAPPVYVSRYPRAHDSSVTRRTYGASPAVYLLTSVPMPVN